MSRPALGYLSVPADVDADAAQGAVARMVWVMRGHAAQRGHDLGRVFLDVRGVSDVGLYCVMAAVRHAEAVVVVPDLAHLEHVGGLAGADLRTVQRYLRARVLVVHTDGAGRRPPPRHAQTDRYPTDRYTVCAARAVTRAGRR